MSCLRQVQQFLLTLEMDGLLPDGVRISKALPRALTAAPDALAGVADTDAGTDADQPQEAEQRQRQAW